MVNKQIGKQTLQLNSPPSIISHYCTVGPMEGQGPLAKYFDEIVSDPLMGQTTSEKAELMILENTINSTLSNHKLTTNDLDFYIAGDLLNQIISATFSARTLALPYIGIYGACSTWAAGLGLASILTEGGYAKKVLVATSSHYQTAERQYRYPIELNVKHKPTNQYTVTGAGAAIVANQGKGPKITAVTFGKVVDFGCKDPNDMGSAMAPAALSTLIQHLEDTNRTLADYDLILTGDLARHGSKMFHIIAKEAGLSLGEKHKDAGAMIYSPQQPVGSGASGAACSATVTIGYVFKEMVQGKYRRVLLIATGALLNQLTSQQGESIPCIAHAVVLEV